jgi:stearoyl-CoA desaturase (delta-9 desaturase)
VINGVGHFFGYRSWDDVPDASRNIVPWGILIGGEELHNNHHAFAASAKLSAKWYEFDIGWMYICMMESLGLATVKRLAPTPRFAQAKEAADLDTLHAVISNRYDVLSRYAKSFRRTYREELERLRQWSPRDAEVLRSLKRALLRGQEAAETERVKLAEALQNSRALATALAMRQELGMLWERSSASKEQLLRQLQDWCRRAEASGIAPLVDFSQRLRSYAMA